MRALKDLPSFDTCANMRAAPPQTARKDKPCEITYFVLC